MDKLDFFFANMIIVKATSAVATISTLPDTLIKLHHSTYSAARLISTISALSPPMGTKKHGDDRHQTGVYRLHGKISPNVYELGLSQYNSNSVESLTTRENLINHNIIYLPHLQFFINKLQFTTEK